MLVRVLIVVAILVVASLAALWWQRRQGVAHEVERAGSLSSATLGAKRGYHATFVQFSTPMCAKCPPTASLLGRLAAEDPRVVHIEIDASERLDLARELEIMRTPTILLLDGDGVVVSRISGAPTEHQAREALAAVPRTGTDYSI
ncbi:thioredoxin family protein [Demequina lignilytica]|uniref:Thioredoxin family protein n=1 Tax=Demequina lignilytica TaxID=3051663 RepID=A0AAW7M515_9MICO|nr:MULTISPECIES: thioredoxin family protein [unclassified Demequina]MDN4477983.1 thioredoxin family protein [Demequina sp. SYSU T00039-1]MDN4484238.1 thioredoxin family protein [Demequina sp. SYSU T0a273]MDN4487892.1 thioredoxin family protein [Demequina sp. SYSU T00039]MDN4490725.1 thioredoxin family protein [Demequina sp. SYSU T00068]